MGSAPVAKAWIRAGALAEILGALTTETESEPCGVLLGTAQGTALRIRRAPRTRNAHPSPATGFRISAQDLLAVVRDAREEGLSVLGFWHGQPHGPADFSEAAEDALERAEALGASARLLVVAGQGTGRARVVRAFARGRHGTKEVPLAT